MSSPRLTNVQKRILTLLNEGYPIHWSTSRHRYIQEQHDIQYATLDKLRKLGVLEKIVTSDPIRSSDNGYTLSDKGLEFALKIKPPKE